MSPSTDRCSSQDDNGDPACAHLENGAVVHDLQPEPGERRLTSNHTFSGPLIIDVQDALGATLHRYVQIPIGGVLIQTQFQVGCTSRFGQRRIERLPTTHGRCTKGPP